jgi:PAS domain S-box-containing protein
VESVPAVLDLRSYQPDLISLPAFLTAAAMLALGVGVVVRERASRESRSFLLLTWTVIVWQLCFSFMYAAALPGPALFWARAAYLGIPLIPPAIYGFTVQVLRIAHRRRTLVRLGWGVSAAFVLVIVFTPAVITGLHRYEWGYYPHFSVGPGAVYLACFLALLVAALGEYVLELRREPTGRSRARVKALLLAFAIAYPAVLDYLPVYGVALYPVGFVFVLGFLVASARAIRRYRLVDLTPSFAADQILSTMADPLIVADARGVIRIANGAVSILGFEPQALTGRPLEVLALDDESEQRAIRALLGDPAVRDLEMRWGGVEVSVSVSELRHGAAGTGEVLGVVIIARDIRDRKRAEEALHRSEEQLRQSQKMEAVGRLAGGVAHDFNNLLTIINGQARLLLEEPAAPDELQRGLEEVVRAGNRAAELTRQLLAFSRRQVLQPRLVDLNAVISETERMLRRLIGEDVELVVSLDAGLDPVMADAGQMAQVLMNLAVNARDAMPGGGRLRLESRNVRLQAPLAWSAGRLEPGDYVRLSVRDTGTGIEPDHLTRIFEPFFTTKGVGKGTGLGLSTVYGIVQQSGGVMRVESEVGRGTCFEIYLARAEAPAEAAESAPAAPPAARGTETVLLVEDDRSVRALARQVLRRRGYRVIEAENGRHALEVGTAYPGHIDLLLSDVVMPELGGPQLAERLCAARPGLRVHFVSGYTDDAIGSSGALRQGIPLLEKPFTPTELAGRVREVLDAPVPEGLSQSVA